MSFVQVLVSSSMLCCLSAWLSCPPRRPLLACDAMELHRTRRSLPIRQTRNIVRRIIYGLIFYSALTMQQVASHNLV